MFHRRLEVRHVCEFLLLGEAQRSHRMFTEARGFDVQQLVPSPKSVSQSEPDRVFLSYLQFIQLSVAALSSL